jgi:hypothetical protein
VTIRGLTLHRPWPWAMTSGSKRIENRCEKTARLLRGWRGKYIALHAGKTWDDEGAEFIRRFHPEMPWSSDAHPIGIVAVVQVGETSSMPLGPAHQHRWFFGPFGTLFEDVILIEPVACRGAQGLWPLPPGALATVRERWKARIDLLDFLARDASGDY